MISFTHTVYVPGIVRLLNVGLFVYTGDAVLPGGNNAYCTPTPTVGEVTTVETCIDVLFVGGHPTVKFVILVTVNAGTPIDVFACTVNALLHPVRLFVDVNTYVPGDPGLYMFIVPCGTPTGTNVPEFTKYHCVVTFGPKLLTPVNVAGDAVLQFTVTNVGVTATVGAVKF